MTDAMTSKRCNRCGVVYDNPTEAFHVDRSRKCGLQNRCKVCALAAWKDPTKHADNLARAARWRAQNRGRIRAYSNEYWHKNKHKYSKAKYKKHPLANYKKRREAFSERLNGLKSTIKKALENA